VTLTGSSDFIYRSSIVTDRTPREVAAELSASWDRSTADPDPLTALAATRDLARGVDRWQGTLVREAIGGGATWEQIGDTLGTSRQAAWARFRHMLEEEKGGKMDQETEDLKRRIHDEVRALREAMKAMDESHRRARHEAVDRLKNVEREAKQERQELRAQMMESIRSLQADLRDRKRSA
jgi:hypothetical protein